MNIVNKLTLSHLKTNKSRSVVTVLGITVSVAMITAVFVALASFMNLFGNLARLADGEWHFQLFGLNQSQIQELRDDERVAAVGMDDECYLNYSLDTKSEKNSVGTISAHNKDDLDIKVLSPYEGTLPKNESEIAVSKDFIEKNSLNWKVGDKVKIPYGIRTKVIDGENVELVGEYTKGETFNKQGEREFKLTAILSEAHAVGSDIVTAKESIDPDTTNGVFIKLKNPGYNSYNDFNDILRDLKINPNEAAYNENTDLLASEFAIQRGGTIASVLPIVAIVLAIILIASVVLIYNAFAMSLNEKVRYLGMLSSVGATKQQKKNSIFFEGFILALIGEPLGILSGVLGIGITLKTLGDKIISTGMLNYATEDNIKMNVVVPWQMVIAIILLSSLTIFASCLIPARKASKVTPIDAIRQSNEIKVKAKRLKTPKIISFIFGYEGELAHKNLKRNGRKARVITVSIALSVILFISCNYFCGLFVQAADIDRAYPYQVCVFTRYESMDAVLDKIDSVKNVDKVYSVTQEYHEIQKIGEDTDFPQLRNEDLLTNSYKNLFSKGRTTIIFYIDDNMFNELCENSGVDYSPYYSSDGLKAVIMNDVSHSNRGNPVFNDKVIGTKISNSYDLDITISGLVGYNKNIPACNFVSGGAIGIYAPLSTYINQISKLGDDELNDKRVSFGIETTQHEQVCDDLNAAFEGDDFSNVLVTDIQQSFQTMDTVVFIIQVFVYGFISLISLITIFNIVNTISTGIISRRKEFAMLQSVGITPNGFNKMLVLESAFYGFKALIFALPLSALISFGMNKALGEASIPFVFDYKVYIGVTLVVMLVIGLTMLYSVKKVQKQNIIETLKDDIV